MRGSWKWSCNLPEETLNYAHNPWTRWWTSKEFIKAVYLKYMDNLKTRACAHPFILYSPHLGRSQSTWNQNSHRHRKDRQTPHRKGPGSGFGPSTVFLCGDIANHCTSVSLLLLTYKKKKEKPFFFLVVLFPLVGLTVEQFAFISKHSEQNSTRIWRAYSVNIKQLHTFPLNSSKLFVYKVNFPLGTHRNALHCLVS